MASAPDAPISPAEAASLFAPLRDRVAVALAVSGGADSSALMYLWSRARAVDPKLPPAHVLTVDHRLRPEAPAEARDVAARAETLGLPHHTLIWAEARAGGNLQARAGQARRRLLLDRARELGCDTLVLAHHADDQAETVLTRLARGSGVVGLAGMAPLRMQDGLLVARPFLDLPKSRLVATLRAAGWSWHEDPSNGDRHYARARLRDAAAILDDLGLNRDRLVTTARVMARAAAALEVQVSTLERAAVVRHPAGWTTVTPEAFAAAPDEIRLRLLSRLIGEVVGAPYGPRLESLEALDGAIGQAVGEGGRLVRTLAGARIELRRDRLWLAAEIGRTPQSLDLAPGVGGVWRGRRVRLAAAAPTSVTLAALGGDGRRALTARACFTPETIGRPAPSAAILESVTAIFVSNRLVGCPALNIFVVDDGAEWADLVDFSHVGGDRAPSDIGNLSAR